MEESLRPMILDLFAKIKRIFNSMQKLQTKRLDNLLVSNEPDAALEKKYTKLRLELFEHVSKIRLNDDRISEILEQLKADGCNIVEVTDIAPWQEATKAVIEENTKGLEDLYQQILDLQ